MKTLSIIETRHYAVQVPDEFPDENSPEFPQAASNWWRSVDPDDDEYLTLVDVQDIRYFLTP